MWLQTAAEAAASGVSSMSQKMAQEDGTPNAPRVNLLRAGTRQVFWSFAWANGRCGAQRFGNPAVSAAPKRVLGAPRIAQNLFAGSAADPVKDQVRDMSSGGATLSGSGLT